eukprot:358841-Chlamydomonas_euryale.AAC.2
MTCITETPLYGMQLRCMESRMPCWFPLTNACCFTCTTCTCFVRQMALIWSKMTTGLPFEIYSARKGAATKSHYILDIDIHK